jgi:hypothetical protein
VGLFRSLACLSSPCVRFLAPSQWAVISALGLLALAPSGLGSGSASASETSDGAEARAFVGIAPLSGHDDEAPLTEVEGEPHQSGELGAAPFRPIADESAGSFFSVLAFPGGDVRIEPRQVSLSTWSGSLSAGVWLENGLRNPDPATGRPRIHGAEGPCETGEEEACLRTVLLTDETCDQPFIPSDSSDSEGDRVANPAYDPRCSFGAGNAQAFERLNEWSRGSARNFGVADESFFDVFRSSAEIGGITTGIVLGNMLSGKPYMNAFLTVDLEAEATSYIPPDQDPFRPGAVFGSRLIPFALPVVTLDVGPADGESFGCRDANTGADCGSTDTSGHTVGERFLSDRFSPEQEALLGCGPFWGDVLNTGAFPFSDSYPGRNCEDSGVHFEDSDASALLQSFGGGSGTMESVRLKRDEEIGADGNPWPGHEWLDSNDYRTDEGLQPGTLAWELAWIPTAPLPANQDTLSDTASRCGNSDAASAGLSI